VLVNCSLSCHRRPAATGSTWPAPVQVGALIAGKRASDVAVGTVDSAHPVQSWTRRAPDGCNRSLLGGFLVILGIDDRPAVFINDVTGIDLFLKHVTSQRCCDPAGMHGEGAYIPALADRIQCHCKQRVGGLRLTVGNPSIVLAPLEVGIVEIDPGAAMSIGAESTTRAPSARSRRKPGFESPRERQ
jgi:hypothetical protein